MTTDLYDAMLWVAIGALGASLLACLLGSRMPSGWGPRGGLAMAGVALVVSGSAAALHYAGDHARSRENAMGIAAFAAEHPAPLLLAGASASLLLFLGTSRWRAPR